MDKLGKGLHITAGCASLGFGILLMYEGYTRHHAFILVVGVLVAVLGYIIIRSYCHERR